MVTTKTRLPRALQVDRDDGEHTVVLYDMRRNGYGDGRAAIGVSPITGKGEQYVFVNLSHVDPDGTSTTVLVRLTVAQASRLLGEVAEAIDRRQEDEPADADVEMAMAVRRGEQRLNRRGGAATCEDCRHLLDRHTQYGCDVVEMAKEGVARRCGCEAGEVAA